MDLTNYTAGGADDTQDAQDTGMGEHTTLQTPHSSVAHRGNSPAASYSARPGQDSPARSSDAFGHRSPAQSAALYSTNSPNVTSTQGWDNFLKISPSGRPTGGYSPAASPLGPVTGGSALPAGDFQGPSHEGWLSPVPVNMSAGQSPSRGQSNRMSSTALDAELPPGTDPPDTHRPYSTFNNSEKQPDANVPERFEQFILAEGEKKCVGKADTRTPNTAIFTFSKEDHTMGNLLKCQLMKDDRVLFSGYKVPHPLVPNFELRIQTDGSITPREALVNCCRAIVVDLETLSREFTKEFELRRIVTGDAKD